MSYVKEVLEEIFTEAKHGIGDYVKLKTPIDGHEYGQVHGWHISGGGMYKGVPTGKATHTIITLKKSPLFKNDYGPKVHLTKDQFTPISQEDHYHEIKSWIAKNGH
jgi:hypothetical protein